MHDSIEELVRAVTERVVAALGNENKLAEAQNEGKKKCLVLGGMEDIYETLTQDMVLLDVKDYENVQNILRYSRVIITKLTMRQLADIAAGSPGDSTTCAVCQALLQGVDVLMLENAPSHRAFAGKGSTAFYRMLEGYVNTLQIFGVKVIGKENPLTYGTEKPQGGPVRCEVNDTKLITEKMAECLAQKAQEIVVPVGTLITPAAMDVLKEARITIIRR